MYSEGDYFKSLGMQPDAFYDRTKRLTASLNHQIFMEQYCLPCMALLKKIFPNTGDLLYKCQ